jgi:hypothetical protein
VEKGGRLREAGVQRRCAAVVPKRRASDGDVPYGAGIGSRDRGVAAVARLRAAAGSASIRERS